MRDLFQESPLESRDLKPLTGLFARGGRVIVQIGLSKEVAIHCEACKDIVVHERSGSTSCVWWEATAIVKRYPSATIIPGAVLGAIAELPDYFIEEHPLLDNALTYVSAALAYYLYLAYAEE
ncbi:MAG TPA: hypothetical protein VFI90_13280, partial [Rubrobacter sp.]|nr:hypothetical protein [Rubrobacter sp.]